MIQDNQDPEEMRKFIFKFNVARTLINNKSELKLKGNDIDKKILNSEDLFFDGRDFNENRNLNGNGSRDSPSLERTIIKNENALDLIKENRQSFFDFNSEIINKRKITVAHVGIKSDLFKIKIICLCGAFFLIKFST